MSLKNNNNAIFFLARRSGVYLGMVCILLGAAFLIVILTLRHSEQERAYQQLHRYHHIFEQNGPAGLQLACNGSNNDCPGFLRLEGPGRRLILVTADNHNGQQTLPDFSVFPATATLVWQALQAGRTLGSWTVASQQLPDHTVLQIGINSAASLILLQRIGLALFKLLLYLLPLCIFAAWLVQQKKGAALRRLGREITQADLDSEQFMLATGSNSDPDERQLINAINQLLLRHRQLTRELHESLDNVAHDMRTPMTRLRAIAEYGLHKDEDSVHLREALSDCLEESDRLLAMLNTMLSVTEAEARALPLNLRPVVLQESIDKVIELYDIIAQEQNVGITFNPEPGLIVLADGQRISQVWANLLDNGIKYNSSTITISSRRRDEMAEITIMDNGMGISENELPKIWTRLYRGDRSRSKTGLGLGLTLVRAIISNHNGSITVSSELDRGTCFTVLLPLAPEQPIEIP